MNDTTNPNDYSINKITPDLAKKLYEQYLEEAKREDLSMYNRNYYGD